MTALPPAVAQIWPEVRAALSPAEEGGLSHASAMGPRVWRLTLDGGRQFVLKFGVDEAPTRREATLLAALAKCPVARLVAHGGDGFGWLLTELAGDMTLDDALPGQEPGARCNVGRALAEAVLDVEETLERRTNIEAERRVQARLALTEQAAAWAGDALESMYWLLSDGIRGALSERANSEVGDVLAEVVMAASTIAPRLGSLDYNPRNVVLRMAGTDGGTLTLIDFPAVGFDWTERRLAQYGTATGSRSTGGTFCSALDSDVAAAYAQRAERIRGAPSHRVLSALDAHEVLLLLMAASQLRLVQSGDAEDSRASAWVNVPERRESLRTLLARPLADEGPAARLRAMARSA